MVKTTVEQFFIISSLKYLHRKRVDLRQRGTLHRWVVIFSLLEVRSLTVNEGKFLQYLMNTDIHLIHRAYTQTLKAGNSNQCLLPSFWFTGSCVAWGDPHFKTFDSRTYDFQGDCEYIMAESVEGATVVPFRIIIKSIPCGSSGVTCTKSIAFTIGQYNLNHLQNDFSSFLRVTNMS